MVCGLPRHQARSGASAGGRHAVTFVGRKPTGEHTALSDARSPDWRRFERSFWPQAPEQLRLEAMPAWLIKRPGCGANARTSDPSEERYDRCAACFFGATLCLFGWGIIHSGVPASSRRRSLGKTSSPLRSDKNFGLQPLLGARTECDLGSTSNLRARLVGIVGTSPSRYRRAPSMP